jgi:cytochrome c oxidase assembly protein Cox11
VPLYDVLCDITGVGNPRTCCAPPTCRRSSTDDSRLITVEFVADLPTVGSWEFRPPSQPR